MTNTPEQRFLSLSSKQRDVLDLVLQLKTSKEIARELGISPDTVDQRIKLACKKLGASTRSDAARSYAALLATYGRSVYQSAELDERGEVSESSAPEAEVHLLAATVTDLDDSALQGWPLARRSLGEIDRRFGFLGRIYLILGMALAIAILFLAIVAMGTTMNGLIKP